KNTHCLMGLLIWGILAYYLVYRAAMAVFILLIQSFLPIKDIISKICGPFISPTITKRKGGMTFPKDSPFSEIHCFTCVSRFSDAKSSVPSKNAAILPIILGESSFHCFLTAFSS